MSPTHLRCLFGSETSVCFPKLSLLSQPSEAAKKDRGSSDMLAPLHLLNIHCLSCMCCLLKWQRGERGSPCVPEADGLLGITIYTSQLNSMMEATTGTVRACTNSLTSQIKGKLFPLPRFPSEALSQQPIPCPSSSALLSLLQLLTDVQRERK